MIKDFLIQEITQELKFVPTEDQKLLISKMAELVSEPGNEKLMLIKGFAGTGKTSTISAFVRALKIFKRKCILMTPTGRAAKVFSMYSGEQAYTIHKVIYRQKSMNDGVGSYNLNKNLFTNAIFLIDEASMISNQSSEATIFGTGRLLDDIIEYVNGGINCKLILIGDTAQLPPVGNSLSPALDPEFLKIYGKKTEEIFLRQVIRQTEGSGILTNATNIRKSVDENSSIKPNFNIKGFNDIIRLPGDELIEAISESYSKKGIENTIIICRSNKQANKYNQGIRNMILGKESELCNGDLLMVVKNNYFWLPENEEASFIANGDIVEVLRVSKYYERYGYRFTDVTLRLIDYQNLEFDARIILDTLTIEAPALTQEDNKKLFYAVAEDYAEVSPKKKRLDKIKTDPFFNALQVKFGYAVTCHKAQGGQWENVFVDQGFVPEDQMDIEYLRWLYTAITRATDKLFLVNFNKTFFSENEE